jgi:molybdenum cofactor biosynthesis enzyme
VRKKKMDNLFGVSPFLLPIWDMTSKETEEVPYVSHRNKRVKITSNYNVDEHKNLTPVNLNKKRHWVG